MLRLRVFMDAISHVCNEKKQWEKDAYNLLRAGMLAEARNCANIALTERFCEWAYLEQLALRLESGCSCLW